MLTLFRDERPARLEEIAALRDGLADALAGTRLPQHRRWELVTAAAELLNNAVEHGAPSPRRVGVRLAVEGGTIVLDVTDDGGPFDRSAARPSVGMSLEVDLSEGGRGLHIVQSLFPNHSYAAGPPNRFRLRDSLRAQRRRILLVEDDRALLCLLQTYLATRYTLDACLTAHEAHGAFRRQRPDLILSDVHLPDGTGIELVRTLAAGSDHRPVPVVFLTAGTDDQTRDRAIGLGIDDFLVKPVSRERLLDTVQRVLVRADKEQARMVRHMTGCLSGALAPGLPDRIGAFACAVASRPAEPGGGDLVFRLPGATDAVVVADVMGHGTGAKVLAHAYAAYFQGLARSLSGDGGPAALLERLTAAIAGDATLDGLVATAAVLDLGADGTIRLASAGHPPALLQGPNGIAAVDVGGPLIGLLTAASYDETEVRLEQGQRLVVYTDGLLKPGAAGTGLQDVPDVLLDALAATAGRPPAEAARAILHTAGPMSDDATLVLIERAAPTDRA